MVDLENYLDDVINQDSRGGEHSSRSERTPGVIEKKDRIRGKTIKVVVVESVTYWNNETVWLI